MNNPVRFISFLSFIFFLGLAYFIYETRTIPHDFPLSHKFLVAEKESLTSISKRLENEGVIRSALWWRIWLSLKNKDRSVQVGYYNFDKPMVLGDVVNKFADGADEPLAQITIPEGSTDREIAEKVNKIIPEISVSQFLNLVKERNSSGFLFPETYYLLPSMTALEIVEKMESTFAKKFAEKFGISSSNFEELKKLVYREVILASILEGEAKTEEDMKIIAGILLKRLEIGMALQVDIAPETYEEKGLPEKPINNPGLVSIDASRNPVGSKYLYYLTGLDGKMYYASTFEEHKKNIQKYLR